MKEDSKPLIFPSSVNEETQEEVNASQRWDRFKKWAFLIIAVVVGLFDVVTDWQNFVKYVSKPEDLKEFVMTVAVFYFLFCCFIGTGVYFWDVWLAYREFKGYFHEEVLSRDIKLRDHVYKEKMYLSLVTILLEDFPCFLLNFYIIYCDSPEDVEEPMFHLASWQSLALISSLVSVVFSFARLLWLNYRYCKIFGCAPKGEMLSSCCVWTNSLLAYLALAAMLYFFFGEFVPQILSFSARQAKLLSQGRKYNIVPVTKTITFEIHDVYHYADRKEIRTRKVSESLFHGVCSNDLRAMKNEGIWLKQDKRCSDIFYHITPRILINHAWNPKKGKFDVLTMEYYWRWEDQDKNCSAIKNLNGSVLTSSCQPLWFEIEPVWCNFTYRIVYDQKNFTTLYNVANMTKEACMPVRKSWITTVVKEDGTGAKRWSYCEKAARKWKPVWEPEMKVCQSRW